MSLKIHLVLSCLIRTIMIAYGEWHDRVMEVKYTDVDYTVITDGAFYIINGKSPFLRHTYRYTPFLAYFMCGNFAIHQSFGKILFSIFDILTGLVILQITKTLQSYNNEKTKSCMLFACLWWYNPLAIVICTRGNADSIMTFLTLLTTLFVMTNQTVLAGIIYGFSIHFKIYPIIYSPALYLLYNCNQKFCFKLIPSRNCIKFFFSAALSFMVPSFFSYCMYGNDYLNESFTYHLSRKDTRHNFSLYFYWLYLTDLRENSSLLNYVIFIPQLILFVLFALKYHKKEDINFCFFSTTFTFVMFNKVCTSQYFLWFLCFLPPVLPNLSFTLIKGTLLFMLWLAGQGLWLVLAYYLEFKNVNTYIYIFLASIVFFAINIGILKQFVTVYKKNGTAVKLKSK